MLDQPVRLIVLGATLRSYAKAFRAYQADPEHAHPAVRDVVLMTAKASAEARMR